MKLNIFDMKRNLVCLLPYLVNYFLVCNSFNLTILHNNDFHSHFDQINVWSSDCKNHEECYGGVARTVAKVKEIKSQIPNVLFLNGGDHFQGTVWYTYFKWQVVAQFVKLMNHTVMALGNHEFDDGPEGLEPFIRNMSYDKSQSLPIISCNIDARNEPHLRGLIKPSIVTQIEGKNIAIIGYTTPETVSLARPGKNVIFHDEVESIEAEIHKLKTQFGDELNIFIAVGHSGFDRDKEIAENVPELDIVVGGHSNTFLFSGPNPPSVEKPKAKYPVIVDHGSDGQTLVVQAFAFGKYLGKLDVVFDEYGKIIRYGGNPILLDSNTKQDPETLAQVKEIRGQLQERFGNVIGKTLVRLSSTECRSGECNLGNVIADSFISYFIESTRKQKVSWTSAPIALINGGAVRTSISAGNITMKDSLSAAPFGNKVGILTVKGSMLWQILQHSGSQYSLGGFMQVSGLRVEYDLSKPKSNRLVKVRVRCAECPVPLYEDLDMTKTYSVVITDYVVLGGDSYSMIDPNDFSRHELIVNEIFNSYAENYSPIYTGLEDRIIFSNFGLTLHSKSFILTLISIISISIL